jgi:hypothetical protein
VAEIALMRSAFAAVLVFVPALGCREVRIVDTGNGGGSSSHAEVEASSGAGACGDTSIDPHHCGACDHDCEGGACNEGVCQPFAIATGFLPGDLALDDANVYVTRSDTGELLRFSKSGGDAITVSKGDSEAWRIGLTDADVFWGGAEGIWRAPKTGGVATQIMSEPVHVGPLTTDGGTVYFAVTEAFGRVGAVPADGGATQTIVPYASLAYDVGLLRGVKKYSSLYWVSQDEGTGELHRLVLDGGGKPETVVGGMGVATEILVAPEGVYVVDSAAQGSVARLDPSGVIEGLLASQPTPASLAIDDEALFVTLLGGGPNEGSIIRIGRTEATGIEVVASGRSSPTSLAVDAHALYWIEQSPSAVMKLVK